MKWKTVYTNIISKMNKMGRQLKQRLIVQCRNNRKFKKVIAIGMIVLTVAGGTFVIGKNTFYQPAKDKTVIVKEFEKEDKNAGMYMEHVQEIKSGLMGTRKLVFAEEQMRVMEKYGPDSNSNVTVEAVFDIGYSIKLDSFKMVLNEKENSIDIYVDAKNIGLDSVSLHGEIKEVARRESIGNKLKDCIPGMNDNEQIKEEAINRLMVNARKKAVRPVSDLENKATESIIKTVKQFSGSSDIKVNVKIIK